MVSSGFCFALYTLNRLKSKRGCGEIGGAGGKAPMPGGMRNVPPEKQIPRPRSLGLGLPSASHSRAGFRGWQLAPNFSFCGGTPPISPRQGDRVPLHPLFLLFHGGEGGSAPSRGRGGVIKGASSPLLQPGHEGDPEHRQTPANEGGENRGVQRAKPPCRGTLGTCPQNGGWRGRSPIPGGLGGVPHRG